MDNLKLFHYFSTFIYIVSFSTILFYHEFHYFWWFNLEIVRPFIIKALFVCLFVCLLFSFLTSSSTTRLYRGQAPRQSVWQFYVLPHMTQSWETITSISAGHIIQTPTQPVGSGRPQRESNPVPPHQESRALPTELPRPPIISTADQKIRHYRSIQSKRKYNGNYNVQF